MFKKIFLVLMISALILSISGCTDEVVEETPANTDDLTDATDTAVVADTISADSQVQDLLPVENIPEGYEFLGSRDLAIEKIEKEYVSVNGTVAGVEGLYMYQDSTDVYIDVIELDSQLSAEEFITEYKAGFNELRSGDDRFKDVTINGHSAVQILEYLTIDINNVKRYTYIWNNGKFVFVVGGATDDSTVLSEIAEATGY
ncbi:MAG: hypothetical protein R2741_10000 [Methanolobus sp.]